MKILSLPPRFAPALLLSLTLLAGCHKAAQPATTAPDRVSVRVAAVELSSYSPPVQAAGELARQTEANLAFSVSGLVEQVGVRPGDRVTRGQELARLKLDTIEAQVAQAGAVLEKAQRDRARLERLNAERVATLENLQDAQTAEANAAAAVRIAQFNREHAAIVAPADGTVLRRLAEPNELVAAGQPVLALAGDGDGWLARCNLAARDAARLRVGAAATVDDGAGGAASGRVVRIAAAADPATRLVPVEVLLAGPTPAARSGLIVSVRLTAEPLPERAAVPLAAIRDGQGGRAYLFVLPPNADTVRRMAVEVELVDGDRAYLRTPIPAGQRVVFSGAQFLTDGAKVRIVE